VKHLFFTLQPESAKYRGSAGIWLGKLHVDSRIERVYN
jgi:hypothetical protein